jgi:hypothetical protein
MIASLRSPSSVITMIGKGAITIKDRLPIKGNLAIRDNNPIKGNNLAKALRELGHASIWTQIFAGTPSV